MSALVIPSDIWKSKCTLRQKVILAMIDAVEDGKPFGTKACANAIVASPETVRNELTALRKLGLVKDLGVVGHSPVLEVEHNTVSTYTGEEVSMPTRRQLEAKEIQPNIPLIKAMVDVWARAMGGPITWGRVSNSVKELVKLYPDDEILIGWKKYLREENPRYASPESFATRPVLWIRGIAGIAEDRDSITQRARYQPLTKEYVLSLMAAGKEQEFADARGRYEAESGEMIPD
jgi:hypothetical protein